MRCCSNSCQKASECALHYSNSFGTHQIEDFSRYGSGGIGEKGTWRCGFLGDYKMYTPIKLTEEEFVMKHCSVCGHQFCGGVKSASFVDCRFAEHLKGVSRKNSSTGVARDLVVKEK